MKKIIFFLPFLFVGLHLSAQSDLDKQAVEKACMNYLDGFYKGESEKLERTLRPSLYKYGYWKNKDSDKYEGYEHMTFEQAVDYSKRVLEKKQFPKEDAPKEVIVLDVMNHIAAAKVIAWWGSDYILLSKEGDKWMIDQVIWEGPLEQ